MDRRVGEGQPKEVISQGRQKFRVVCDIQTSPVCPCQGGVPAAKCRTRLLFSIGGDVGEFIGAFVLIVHKV